MRKTKLGQELIIRLEEALEYERGLRSFGLQSWKSRSPHAHERRNKYPNSVSTVRAWEQGQKSPSGAAKRST